MNDEELFEASKETDVVSRRLAYFTRLAIILSPAILMFLEIIKKGLC